MIPLPFIFGAFGLIVGSFLNVVILRFGEKGIGGRSACPQCGTTLAWYDLIPVLSYLLLRGQCRYCRARISVQYPLVEASTALAFLAIGGAELPISATICALALAAFLVCIFVYDLRHKLIPDVWVWAWCALAFVFSLVTMQASPVDTIFSGVLAALPILFLWALSYPLLGLWGGWMGFGDVKLALGIGLLLPLPTPLGLPLGLVAIFLAFIIGASVSVCILLPLPHILAACGIRTKEGSGGYTMKSEVPFGPFLITSCALVWFAVLYGVSIPFLL